MMVVIGHGVKGNRLRVWLKWNGWRDYYLQYTNFIRLCNKKSVIVSPVIVVYTLRKRREIKRLSFLTRLPCSLVP